MLTAAQPACDPCAGVARCERGAYLAVNGQIVDPATGAGMDGVRIDIVRRGGLALESDSLSVLTGDGGHWRLQLSPVGQGAVDVDIVVSVPGFDPYRVPTVLETREHGGDARVLDRWVPVPYFAYAGEFFLSGTDDVRAAGVAVEFRRTSGVLLRGPGIESGVFRATTDAAGRVNVFPATTGNAVLPATIGAVVGDFVVRLAPPLGTTTVRGVRLEATPVYRRAPAIIRAAVGPGAQ